MEEVANLIEAIASALWPAIAMFVLFLLRHRLLKLLDTGAEVGLEFMGAKLSVRLAPEVESEIDV